RRRSPPQTPVEAALQPPPVLPLLPPLAFLPLAVRRRPVVFPPSPPIPDVRLRKPRDSALPIRRARAPIEIRRPLCSGNYQALAQALLPAPPVVLLLVVLRVVPPAELLRVALLLVARVALLLRR